MSKSRRADDPRCHIRFLGLLVKLKLITYEVRTRQTNVLRDIEAYTEGSERGPLKGAYGSCIEGHHDGQGKRMECR